MSLNNENNDEYNIYKFLEERVVQTGHTHTSMCNPKGSYYIEEHDLDTFYEYYEKALFDNELHITERHCEISPIIIDLDFKYELETFERKHKVNHIEKIVNLYVSEICNLFELERNDKRLISFIFERDELYKIKGITKDGIHIIFPNIVSHPDAQYYIRNNILKKIVEIISDLGLKNVISDVVDKSVIAPNTCWLLYGSNKDRPKGNPYRLKYIFDGDGNQISIEDYFGEEYINLARFFSIRGRKVSDLIPIRADKLNVLSAISKKKILKTKSNSYLNYDIERIRELVSILSDERIENYSQWIEVGWMLHNIDPCNDELLEIWINFSKKSNKFVEGECEKLWDNMKSEGLTIATLHYWAKIDNYTKYNEFKNKDINKHIETSIKTQSNYDIAYVLHKMYEYDFVYCDNDWYMYKNHRWHKETDGMSLRMKISTELHEKYVRLMSYYNQIAGGKVLVDNHELTEEEKEEYKKKNGVVLDLTKKLKTTSFKDNVMRECKELFSKDNKEFSKKLDANPTLLGFNNGIYDLEKGEFRDGRPDDFIEISTEIDKIDFDNNNEHWEDLEHFLNTVFFDEEIRNYFLTYLSSCLQGHNAEEKFRFWTGIGCHAINTPIMMSDGTTKNVQDIIVGDKLMGDDSTERNVIELKHGFSDMYNITTIKGEKFTVNGEHIICLKATTIGSLNDSLKEHRYKLSWQEKDNNGIPVNKCKNFAYKHENRKIYNKNVIYYENEEDAKNSAIKFKELLYKNPNYIKNGDVIDIKVKDYLNIRKKIGDRNYFLYKVGIDFEKKDLPLDPYMIGYWLGDGTSMLSSITTMDHEVEDYFSLKANELNLNIKEYKKDSDKASTFVYSSKYKGSRNKLYENTFYQTLKKLKLLGNKHIPDLYKYNDRNNRLNILAGIIDSDGHYQARSNQYEITLKSEKLIDDILYLARSLGFSCSKKNVTKSCQNFTGHYFNIIIYGSGIEDIPVLLKRKKAIPRIKNKNASYYGFNIEKVEDNYFYGFELDGNHRYLMGDFTVTHNSNGKSKILELFVHSLGDYTVKFPITLITGKRAASNACTPEVLQSKGKRFGYFEEPGEGEKINAGLLKEFTGGDKIKARGLHKDPIEFKPQFKLALLCNDMPEAPPNDTGYWRRMEVIEFKSHFCEKPKEPHEFPIDKYLSQKMKNWKELFMALLLDVYYVKYKKSGIKVPLEVVKFTLEYQKQCDQYADFISENLSDTNNMNDLIIINDMYEEFKTWFEEAFGNHKFPTKKEFKAYLKKRYGKRMTTTEIKGFKFRIRYEKSNGIIEVVVMSGF